MKIVVNGNHQEKLAAALAEAQKGCRARTLDVGDVEHSLEVVTYYLDISKRAMAGTELHFSGAEKFAKSYKYPPMSTHIVAKHDGRHWVITGVSRDFCPDRRSNVRLTLSDSAKEALLDRFGSFRI